MNLCIGYNKEFQYLLNNYNNNSLSNSIIISGQKGIPAPLNSTSSTTPRAIKDTPM